ncbi:hypothetical protein QQ045_022640 [Rhodiola kirilowii]
MARTCSFSFSIALVVIVIAYIYTTTIFLFINRRFGLITSPGIMSAFAFTCLTALTAYSYALAVFTDPGRVPASYTPDAETTDNMVLEVQPKDGDSRYCQKCSHYKPPRAHHCRVCRRCVLKMDHHCVWINNCVGHANYKFFFVFLLYAFATCSYSMVLLINSFPVESHNKESENGSWLGATYVISGILSVTLTVLLGSLLMAYILRALNNMTTLEGHRLWLLESRGEIYEHPYDLGVAKNLSLVLGPNVLMWVWPTSRFIGSGLHFPTMYDNQGAESS